MSAAVRVAGMRRNLTVEDELAKLHRRSRVGESDETHGSEKSRRLRDGEGQKRVTPVAFHSMDAPEIVILA